MFKLYLGLILSINIYAATQYTNNKVEVSQSKNDKVFTREYTYNASDDDSKNSAREKALSQLKALLSEEVGTHIQSSLNMQDTIKNGVKTEYIKSEINSLSASITKLKILNEKWNGKTYYVKADVKLNEDETMNLLLEAIKAKASEKDIKRLNKILNEQNSHLDKSYEKIQELQKKLVLQEIQNKASIQELEDTKVKLQELQTLKEKYEYQKQLQKNEISRIQSEINKIKKQMDKESEKACQAVVGMKRNEVSRIIGTPRDTSSFPALNQSTFYYGQKVGLVFSGYLLKNIYGCD